MMYISTRGKSEPVPASVAIMQGLAPDGGLYIPEEIPALTRAQLRDCVGYDYRQKAKLVLGMFLTDFSEQEIEACVDKAYTAAKFGSDDTVPLHALGGDRYLLELWHGPTCAFKDIALQILPHLLLTSMRKNGEEKTAVILVATSGDTGKAALEGFCDVDGSKIMVFYPQDGVSNIQKLQMITQDGANVCSVGIEGNFDDAQTGVKAIFSDPDVQQALLGKAVSSPLQTPSTGAGSSRRLSTISTATASSASRAGSRSATKSTSSCPPATSAISSRPTLRAAWACLCADLSALPTPTTC